MISYFCGIDVGLKGGIVLIDKHKNVIDFWAIPLIDKKTVDLKKLNLIFKDELSYYNPVIYIERVWGRPKQSSVATFNFGKIYGILLMLLVSWEYRYIEVAPITWTKKIHQGIDKKLPSKKKSLLAFQTTYPDVDFRRGRQRVNPDGLIDALLIAEYGRIKLYYGK